MVARHEQTTLREGHATSSDVHDTRFGFPIGGELGLSSLYRGRKVDGRYGHDIITILLCGVGYLVHKERAHQLRPLVRGGVVLLR